MIRLIVILVFLSSCSISSGSKYSKLISKADKFHIAFGSDSYVDTTILMTSGLRNSFEDVFQNSERKCFCKYTGRIRFFSNGVVSLVADFSVDDENCQSLVVFPEGDCFKLNYSIGMGLGYYWRK